GNVCCVLIPAHWGLVRAKQAGREPDPRWNARAKLRSVHNNYLTLPVVLAMISTHFAFLYTHSNAWLLLVVLMVLGAWTRHYFNLRHRGRNAWWILASAAAGVVVVAVLIRPGSSSSRAVTGPPPAFAAAERVVHARCAPCHSMNPTQPGYSAPPAGIRFDTRAEIEAQAALIDELAVQSTTMPPGNATGITQAERDLLGRWV